MEHNSLEVWKIIYLSKWVICRFHVNLPGCIPKFVLQSSISSEDILLEALQGSFLPSLGPLFRWPCIRVVGGLNRWGNVLILCQKSKYYFLFADQNDQMAVKIRKDIKGTTN